MRPFIAMALLIACACARYSEPRVFEDSMRQVPGVAQKTVADASSRLEGEGLLVRLQRKDAPDTESLDVRRCPEAKVLRSDPPAGSRVVKATIVTIVVARCG